MAFRAAAKTVLAVGPIGMPINAMRLFAVRVTWLLSSCFAFHPTLDRIGFARSSPALATPALTVSRPDIPVVLPATPAGTNANPVFMRMLTSRERFEMGRIHTEPLAATVVET